MLFGRVVTALTCRSRRAGAERVRSVRTGDASIDIGAATAAHRGRRRAARESGAMHRRAVLAGLGLAVIWAVAPATGAIAQPVDDALAQARAKALVGQMTLDEKISQVHGTGFITGDGYTGFTPAIPRLRIPPFYLADGPNGVGNGAKGVTAFPAAINNASTWDAQLLGRYGQVLGAEH